MLFKTLRSFSSLRTMSSRNESDSTGVSTITCHSKDEDPLSEKSFLPSICRRGKRSFFRHLFNPSNGQSGSVLSTHTKRPMPWTPMLSQYGTLQPHKIGEGSSATVRLSHLRTSTGSVRVYAVKSFRKRHSQESELRYLKKVASEFCISGVLRHPNIVETFDLVMDKKGRLYIVMDYCSGGDLYYAIRSGTLSVDDVHCYFKQLLMGLSYLHSIGVAHRDIKPENLLLRDGFLKISDFGTADVFRQVGQEEDRLSDGLCGSTCYFAPEIFLGKGYHGARADVWSAGIVYFCMHFNGVPFGSAQKIDPGYRCYLRHFPKRQYPSFRNLSPGWDHLIYAMLHPRAELRITSKEALQLPCFDHVPCQVLGHSNQRSSSIIDKQKWR
ncbi:kinase-like domain-containing protein [Radiomyces spectabilis]|uniref:kinase-like domain-containing protein n=1 Tax=Radiomyces spectabilis TaxID=64574 RepID=UPI00221F14A2|nr:kinase-like domain-containing protein [Radiomyces spectabilis]KAI8370417.1 kinase-like domain-containing protein [Radiomyces spectabilis]